MPSGNNIDTLRRLTDFEREYIEVVPSSRVEQSGAIREPNAVREYIEERIYRGAWKTKVSIPIGRPPTLKTYFLERNLIDVDETYYIFENYINVCLTAINEAIIVGEGINIMDDAIADYEHEGVLEMTGKDIRTLMDGGLFTVSAIYEEVS